MREISELRCNFLSVSLNFASQVSLLPPGLARKRLWNRKYPICITLDEGEVGEERMLDGQEEEWERVEGQAAAAAADHQLPVTLYLFGRTGREKEEWFQHFLSASRTGTKCSVSCEENTGRSERHWEEKTDVPPRWIALHGCRLSLSLSLSPSQRPHVVVTPPGKAQRGCTTLPQPPEPERCWTTAPT